jgi:hypothetical protein
LGVSSSIRRASYIAVFGVLRFWSVTILRPHVAAFCAEFNSFPCIQLSQPVLELLIFVGNIWLVDLAFRDFGSFPIRSAISVRSIGLGRLTAIRPYQARYVMLGPLVLAICSTRPRGTVVLRSSTPCTLAYLTELWPTFTNFCPPLVLTLATMLFRLFLVGYIEKVVMSDNTGTNFNSTYHRYLSTDFDAVWCLGSSAQCPVRIHREIRYGG